ncbi:MAG: peptide-methionine (R)-S-oxide reductase MsrB [Rhizobiaceae bacterium]
MKRRHFLSSTFLALGALALPAVFAGKSGMGTVANASEGKFEIEKTQDEWRKILSEEQYAVLREEATERPFTSALLEEKREGNYHCAACDLPAYGSYSKFDSGTGWPSFYEPLKDAIGTKEDNSLFSMRTEIHCRRCGGHFGHVFDDGPQPTGMRHCLNGLALTFMPKVA